MLPPVVILCGGLGTRARVINKNLPKALIKINKKPFLYWLLKNLEKNKVTKVFLCIGYKGEQINKYISQNKNKFKLDIQISNEGKKLLGTGGAINKIYNKLGKYFYVMNGDSFLFLNLKKMFKTYLIKKKPVLMVILKNQDKKHKNNVIKKKNYILYNHEIKNPKMKYIDYGIILMKKNILKKNTKKFQLSIFLKYLSENKQITYMVTKKNFFEIGSLYGYRQTINNFHKITKELNEI